MEQDVAGLMRESCTDPTVGDTSSSSVKCSRHDNPVDPSINELAEAKHAIRKISVVGHHVERLLDQSVDPDRARPVRQQLRILQCTEADVLDLIARKVGSARASHN